MAVRPARLIAALAAVVALGAAAAMLAASRPATATDAPSCNGCHPVHYETRGTCTGCHRGDPATRRRDLAHADLLTGAAAAWSMAGAPALAEGERLRDALGCRRCHVTGGRGNALAQSLDALAWKRTQAQLRTSIIEPATFMPDFGLARKQADALIAVLLRDGARGARESRYLVHFRGDAPAAPNAFVKKCGPCHRALTAAGPLGIGADGPNLSGLLTPFYPATDGRAWTAARLADWLRNPRAERPAALMRPVELTPEELAQVDSLLTPAGLR